MGDSNAETGKEQQNVPAVTFKLQFGKNSTELSMPLSATVGDIKEQAHRLLSIPPAMQKLLIKGSIKPDTTTLQDAGIKKGLRVMLIGSRPQDILSAAAPATTPGLTWDSPTIPEEDPVQTQTQHKKVIDKGKPEDGMPGIADRQIPLGDHENMIPGLLNGQGSKVRLTFKPAEQQVWIGSAASTQKVYYHQIKKIESHVIQQHEEYSMVAFHLNAEGKGKYWLYWFPSQYVAAIKMQIIGVTALV